MKIYIIGNSKGPALSFYNAAAKLEELGHIPVFCHQLVGDIDSKDWDWADFRKLFLKAMLDCDIAVTLPEYQSCRGAQLEFDLAVDLKMKLQSITLFVNNAIKSADINPN